MTAFVDDGEARAAVEQALSDRRLEKSTVNVESGSIDEAISYFGDNPTPDLIIIEAAENGNAMLEKIDSLAEVCEPGTQVVILGKENNVQIYRSLIQQGVSDYLVPPFSSKEIFETIAAVSSDPSEASLGRIISFMGAKGGTGSSTVAHNTAWALAQSFDDDVIVLDLDLAFGTVALAFNLESQQGIQHALAHPERLDEVLLERFLAKHDEHIRLLTSPGSLEADTNIDVESFDVVLNLVRRTAPFVVLDLPHMWAPWSRQLLTDSDEVVITSTLDLAALRDTKNLYDALSPKRQNDSPIRIVLNHDGAYRRTQLTAKDFEGAIGTAPLVVLPHEPNLFGTAANNGQMIGEVNKRSKIVEQFNTVGQTVSGRDTPKKKKKSGFPLLRKIKAKVS